MLLQKAVFGLNAGKVGCIGEACKAILSAQATSFNIGHETASFNAPLWQQQTRGQRGVPRLADEMPLNTGRGRLVVLGTGWAASRLIRDLNPNLFDFTVPPALALDCI